MTSELSECVGDRVVSNFISRPYLAPSRHDERKVALMLHCCVCLSVRNLLWLNGTVGLRAKVTQEVSRI